MAGNPRRNRSFIERISCWRKATRKLGICLKRSGGCRQTLFLCAVRDGLLQLDSRNIAGEARPSFIGGVLPINFVGGPDTVVKQIKECRDQTGAGVIDLMFQTPSSSDAGDLMHALELFGRKVLPRIRDF
jgi:alkanesulfonate monooxygenase SsuD/methylene tetrahydromethanopterin reductase-like flavin-dependent oxidoreductase (luciferase family)